MKSGIFPMLLHELAFLSELKGENPFKIRALENSAKIFEEIPEELEQLFSSGKITKIPGIGKGTQALALEFLQTGDLQELRNLKGVFPETIFELLEVQGLGPKKCRALYEQLRIASLSELEYACQENRLIELKGFGEKTQKNILKSIQHLKANQGKIILPNALQEAEEQQEKLLEFPCVKKVEIVGELRRAFEFVSTIDLLLIGNPKEIESSLEKSFFTKKENHFEAKSERGIPLRLFLCAEERAGTELALLTGPEHFVQGLSSSPSRTEEEFFQKNNMPYFPPECRDLGRHPETLIKEKDIRGVFHLHTTWSDGSNTLEEMVTAAIALGFEYLGVSDHSQSAFYAKGLKEDRVLAQKKEIDELQKKFPRFRIFHGIESDILPDGSLDYSDTFLKNFDFVIASVHSQMKQSAEEMTKRICRALENPYTTWLGHWTGRILLGRSEFSFHKEMVIESAAKNKKGIEINSNPYRLDIDWRDMPKAAASGVTFGIFPDAHNALGLSDIKYGVLMARKAGLTKTQVINTLNAKEMEKWLKSR